MEHYFPKERIIQKGYPLEMRYAGPREALLHALFRQNYGATHLIVGRDHAGVGDYYGPFEAQDIFDQIPSNALMIKPLKIDWTFYCYKCQTMASPKTCPHGKEDHLTLSGTKLRKMLSEGKKPPAGFSRPEVLDILMDYYQHLEEKADSQYVQICRRRDRTGLLTTDGKYNMGSPAYHWTNGRLPFWTLGIRRRGDPITPLSIRRKSSFEACYRNNTDTDIHCRRDRCASPLPKK